MQQEYTAEQVAVSGFSETDHVDNRKSTERAYSTEGRDGMGWDGRPCC